ncbi:hypothetical protein SBRY_140088 [Actinacidiphila bryophytorum]|uniref:Uncharacterized protein n=1 Tax=Actinacidiphila bryophytorum TaxID=1436133 RepID=A0A9W4EDF1_9ACTN|nr:hypothetical protein SBRY_140088 [Actinacidiphila bryophytorum]
MGGVAGGAAAPGAHPRAALPLPAPGRLLQRRLHRRLGGRRGGRQRLAAAVADPGQRGGRLVQRRVEPGLLGRRGRPRAVLPRPAVHHAADHPGQPREALPVRGRDRPLPGVPARAAARHRGCELERGAHPRQLDPDRAVLHRQALGLGAHHQQGAGAGQAPAADPGHLPADRHDQGQVGGHGGARAGLRHPHPGERRGRDAGGRRARGADRGPALRRGRDRVAVAAGGRRRARAAQRPAEPDVGAGRVLPGRRRGPRAYRDRTGGQQRQRAARPHLGLARRPRQRGGLDGEHRRVRRRGQRRQRAGHGAVRGALPEVQRGLERRPRQDGDVPERAAVRPAEPGRLPPPRRGRLGGLQGGRLGAPPRGLGPGQLLLLHRRPDDPCDPQLRGAGQEGRALPRPADGVAERRGRDRACDQRLRSRGAGHRHGAGGRGGLPGRLTGGPAHPRGGRRRRPSAPFVMSASGRKRMACGYSPDRLELSAEAEQTALATLSMRRGNVVRLRSPRSPRSSGAGGVLHIRAPAALASLVTLIPERSGAHAEHPDVPEQTRCRGGPGAHRPRRAARRRDGRARGTGRGGARRRLPARGRGAPGQRDLGARAEPQGAVRRLRGHAGDVRGVEHPDVARCGRTARRAAAPGAAHPGVAGVRARPGRGRRLLRRPQGLRAAARPGRPGGRHGARGEPHRGRGTGRGGRGPAVRPGRAADRRAVAAHRRPPGRRCHGGLRGALRAGAAGHPPAAAAAGRRGRAAAVGQRLLALPHPVGHARAQRPAVRTPVGRRARGRCGGGHRGGGERRRRTGGDGAPLAGRRARRARAARTGRRQLPVAAARRVPRGHAALAARRARGRSSGRGGAGVQRTARRRLKSAALTHCCDRGLDRDGSSA